MIVRLMGLGQWSLEPEQLLELNEIDQAVEAAVEANNPAELRQGLERLVSAVQAAGTEVPDDVIVESDLVLPDVTASIEEVRALLESISDFYGLVPDAAEHLPE